MTIFVEDFIKAGFCKWENGKIIVSPSCPADVRRKLQETDEIWRNFHKGSGSIVIFMKK